jgi:hypothetical protein
MRPQEGLDAAFFQERHLLRGGQRRHGGARSIAAAGTLFKGEHPETRTALNAACMTYTRWLLTQRG